MRPSRFDSKGPEQAENYSKLLGDRFDTIESRRAPPRPLPQLLDEVCIHRRQRHYIFWAIIDHPNMIVVMHKIMHFSEA